MTTRGTAGAMEVSGSARVYWKGMRQSVRVSHIQVRGVFWRAAVGIKQFGFGKVCRISC